MQWLVSGTRGGKPGRWKLEAADEWSARQKAVAGGVTVQEIRPITAPADVVSAPMAAIVPTVARAPEFETPDPPAESHEVSETEADDAGFGNATPTAEDSGAEEPSPESVGLEPAPLEAAKAVAEAPAASTRSGKPKAERHFSIWGIAAVVLGLAAFVTGFISAASVASIPLAGVGLALAIAGIVFSVKRKRAGMLLPVVGTLVCAGSLAWTLFGKHKPAETAATDWKSQEEHLRAERIAQAKVNVQFISIRPAAAGKYALALNYSYMGQGMAGELAGRIRISDPSGQEVQTLSLFESFTPGLGAAPVQKETVWELDSHAVQLLQSDPSHLKFEFDPSF